MTTMETLARMRESLAEHESNVVALVDAAETALRMCDLVESDLPGVVNITRSVLGRALAPFASQSNSEALARANSRFSEDEPVEYRWSDGNDQVWRPGVIAAPDRGGALVSVRPDGGSTAFNVHRKNVRAVRVPVVHAANLDRS